MFLRFPLPRGFLLVSCLVALCASASAQTRRPLRHSDADGWRAITAAQLSRNGQFVAHALFPQEGDGEYVVRDLKAGREWRYPTGGSAGLAGTSASRGRPTQLRGSALGGARIGFTADSRLALVSIVPTRKDIEQARADKKSPPRPGLLILELASFQATRLEGVRSWSLPEDSSDYFAYFRLPKADPATTPMQPIGQSRPGTGRALAPAKVFGSDLVLYSLGARTERTIADVVEFSFTKDAKALVYTVSSKKEEENGVYLTVPGSAMPTAPLLSGKGRYQRLTWDENQEQLVFLAEQGEAPSTSSPSRFKLHHWERKAATVSFALPPASPLTGLVTLTALQGPGMARATELLSSAAAGFKPSWIISERGILSFSRDGSRVNLSTSPPPDPAAVPVPADKRVDLDLWHWKDDYLQPMQKARLEQEQGRTYQAVYHLKQKKFVQLADESVQNVASAADAAVTLGSDDRPYRRLLGQAGSDTLTDVYTIDLLKGTRKLLRKKVEGGVHLSPGGKYALSFDGKNWHSLNLSSGKSENLTEKLGVAFHNEENDKPGRAASHGFTGWTSEDAFVLINDRFDIWQLAPDGASAKNLTQGAGRKGKVQFRYTAIDPRERTIGLDQPLLLHAQNLETFDTGFHRLDPVTGVLRCLIVASRSFTVPVKARDADVYLLTAQSFNEPPDLIVTDPSFKELKKVTNANPQKKDLIWGKAELVGYKNSDGLALRGILVKPENFQPGKKYPMVVYIYERLSPTLHRFVAPRPGTSINPTYYASNGYLVLMPDIAYRVGTPGQSAIKCVLPAIQAVVDKGIVDEKAIGIQGHSWGGYQISYMVTQTTRFKAAIAGAPVSNMVSAYGGIRWGTGLSRQFQYEQSQSRIGGTLWQYQQRFLENSPVFMADRVQTPLLMLHNDQDDAVPWYQGIEYYMALRRLEKEVYLLNYNNERHGLVKRSHQKDYTVRMQEFFDHHLKGAPKPAWMEKGVSYLDRVKKYGAPSAPISPFVPPTGPATSGEIGNEEP